MEELTYHVDFGPYYVHLTQKQKRYLAARSIIDRILAALATPLLQFSLYCNEGRYKYKESR